VQKGLSFPWQEELLVAALPLVAARQLAAGRRILWGKTTSHLCLRRGPWTFYLACTDPALYPAVLEAVPPLEEASTGVQMTPTDAALLMRTLSRLGWHRLQDEAVTLDLAEYLVVHSQQSGQKSVCTLALRSCRVLGPPVRLRTASSYLLRGMQLGFRELIVTTPAGPLRCQDGWRSYLWMPLLPVNVPSARAAPEDGLGTS
jgi:hypothetical protein